MGIKRFLLFTATDGERKQYVASFDTREAGVSVAEKLEGNGRMRWQVIDSDSSKIVAEHRSSEEPAAPYDGVEAPRDNEGVGKES